MGFGAVIVVEYHFICENHSLYIRLLMDYGRQVY